jgi:hypothetical protein
VQVPEAHVYVWCVLGSHGEQLASPHPKFGSSIATHAPPQFFCAGPQLPSTGMITSGAASEEVSTPLESTAASPDRQSSPLHLLGSLTSADLHPEWTQVLVASQATLLQSRWSSIGRFSSTCGSNRSQRRATMQPAYCEAALHSSTGRSMPATTRTASSASLSPLGTTISVPTRLVPSP